MTVIEGALVRACVTTQERVASSGPTPGGANDPAALEALYRTHGPALRRLCRSRLGNAADADDACQEALLRAWRALGGVDASRPLWPWLATIAARTCIDLQRRQQRARIGVALTPTPPVEPDEEMLRHGNDRIVRDAMAALPRPDRTVLVLRDVEGRRYEEISRLQRRSEPAVRAAVVRARRHLLVRLEVAGRACGQWPLAAFVAPLILGVRRRVARIRGGTLDLATRLAAHIETTVGAVAALAVTPAAFGALFVAVGGLAPAAATAAAAPPVPIAALAAPAPAGSPAAFAAPAAAVAPPPSSAPAAPVSAPPARIATPLAPVPMPSGSAGPVAVRTNGPTHQADGGTKRVSGPAGGATLTTGAPADAVAIDIVTVTVACPPPSERNATQQARCAPLDP